MKDRFSNKHLSCRASAGNYGNLLAIGLVGALFLTGCASSKVTNHDRLVYDQLPRPGQIVVWNFAADAADAPADSSFMKEASVPATPPTEEQMKVGRELGALIAEKLASEIKEMGLPAIQVSAATAPNLQINDIMIRGYLVSVDEGNTAKRMTIGFGSGSSEIFTAVEGYQMTATGLRKLGSANVGAKGSKGPGAALGAAGWIVTGNPIGLIVGGGMKIYGEASGSAKVEGRAKQTAKEIADQLKIRFEQEGWIN